MKKQPELPDFVRDLEIVQSLNRRMMGTKDLSEDRKVKEDPEISDTSM
ncbi:hypothetical protein [Alicyclobacillus sp. SO9]|nr:hypothetical protein [Alicyclobacillus sp. SO9]QQE80783.1 hypothetical protein GI364_10600 [Alicyclobacillus sp. SO9]